MGYGLWRKKQIRLLETGLEGIEQEVGSKCKTKSKEGNLVKPEWRIKEGERKVESNIGRRKRRIGKIQWKAKRREQEAKSEKKEEERLAKPEPKPEKRERKVESKYGKER